MAKKQLKKKIQHSDTFYITRQNPGIVQSWNDSRTQVNRNRRETKEAISKASIMVPSSAPEIAIPYNGTPVKDKATHVSYIGGDKDAARKAYWEEAPIIKAATDSIAGRYGINPELLRSRLDKEGFTDSAINIYNGINTNVDADNRNIIRAKVLGYPYLHSEGEHNIGIQRFGLDDGATYINSGLAHLINESWNDGEFTNEKGRVTNAANGASILDNMGIMASLLKGFRNQAAQDYPNATPEELDNYANIYYNRGITGGRNYINNGNGSTPYTMAEGGPLQTHKTWDDLSMTEKAAMMKVAVRNGITSLNEIKAHYNEFAEGGNLYSEGSYLDKAKAMIRANEGWRSTPYKDAPKGKNWRSVGYGFNDSGFWEKYPDGISKHYEKGITKAQAEQELTYYLGKAERQLRGIYGKRWDSFNDDQKAAILDTYYQSPASVGSKSGFYSAVMAGRDGAPYLGVRGFGDRNQSRRDLYRGRGVSAPMTFDTISEPASAEPEMISFKPLNPQAFDNPMFTYTPPTLMEEPVQVNPLAEAYNPEELERQEKRDNLERFNMFMSMLSSPSGEDTTGLTGMLGAMNMLSGNKKAEGGNLFDGDTEPTQQMQQGYIRQRPEGTYFYDVQGQPEIDVTPLNTSLSSNPADWSFTDASGKIYSPHRDAVQGTGELREGNQEGPILSAVNNYLRELNWRAKNDPASIALQGKYTMPAIAATALLPWLGEAAATTNVAGVPLTTLADAGLTSAFAGHGLNHWLNEGINGWGDAAMTALEVAPLGRLARPLWNAGKEGLQYAVKAADNTVRYVSPSYDLYRTISETTPRTTPTYHGFRLNGEQVYTGSPLFEFANIQRASPSESYFFRAPDDIDILKLGNGRFRSRAQGNTVLPSGNVNGKFVSYGEPWQEFDFGEGRALYEFPVGPRRGPSRMATDWRGNKQNFSVDKVYEFMQQEKALSKELKELRNNGTINSEREEREIRKKLIQDKYPLVGDTKFSSSINSANQTVIPNERWNFDWFLKTPFWKYSENPLSGQVQKELMMRWPEAKPLETPAIEWTDAARTPQITAENAASITPEQWTAAQDAAIAKGDMAEAQRLRDLHFSVEPITHYYRGSKNALRNTYFRDDGSAVWITPDKDAAKVYTSANNSIRDLYVKFPKDVIEIDGKGAVWDSILREDLPQEIQAVIPNYYVKPGTKDILSTTDIVHYAKKAGYSTVNFKNVKDATLGKNPMYPQTATRNYNNIKLADAVTFTDDGVRIPLGERDNFNINDIRYGLLPFGIGLTGYGILGNDR